MWMRNYPVWCIDDDLHLTARRKSFHLPYIPPFANDDQKLAQVLRERAWHFTHHLSTPCPPTLSLVLLNAAATQKATAESSKALRDVVKRTGGYMELQAAIAYKSWRLGIEAKEIAKELGISSSQVRQISRRLRAEAAKLGYDCGKRHHSLRNKF
jgi:DNA-directed RNA polymerase specialized sigma24 family protein